MAKKKVFSIGTALSQGLEETIESAQHYSNELRIDILPIRKIEFDPANPRGLMLTIKDIENGIDKADSERIRKTEELASLQSMAHSIKTQGIINPITVYKYGDKYRLIAGERRTLASILAGKTNIQAKIIDDKPDELKISLLQWIENIERSDLSLWERLNNLEKIIRAYADANHIHFNQITTAELCQLIGCVKSHALNYKAILNADEQLKHLISENKIKNLEKAALISNIQTADIKQQAINACIAGATLKQLKIIAEQDHHQKSISIKLTERRGRQSTAVHLGSTKNLRVAKLIAESILSHHSLMNTTSLEKINWSDHRHMTDLFKYLLKTLEKSHI